LADKRDTTASMSRSEFRRMERGLSVMWVTSECDRLRPPTSAKSVSRHTERNVMRLNKKRAGVGYQA
jgi:hypothetical protein